MNKLTHDFYNRHVVEVAQELLGKTLVFGNTKGIITETEAYRGLDDEASHAFKGPTQRSHIMFGPAGYSYVYLIYGMYHCLNIVTEEEGQASAVLIRGLLLPEIHLNGPGKLCRHLGITKQHHGLHLISHDSIYVAEGIEAVPYTTTPRIGIKKATDKLWRFVVDPSSFLSSS
jgi:DNA-3-methyladenine glycosylase